MLHVLTSTKKKAVFRGEEIHRENGFFGKAVFRFPTLASSRSGSRV
jgi:hypothetical protein